VPGCDGGKHGGRDARVTHADRRPRHEPEPVGLAGLQHRVGVVLGEVEAILDGGDADELARAPQLIDGDLRHADEADLALVAELTGPPVTDDHASRVPRPARPLGVNRSAEPLANFIGAIGSTVRCLGATVVGRAGRMT
jgi:hypothetical protein